MSDVTTPSTGASELLGLDESDPATRLAIDLAEADYQLLEQLVEMRHRRHIKQCDLAKMIGRSQPTLSEFERLESDPRMSTVRRYAAAVGVRVHHEIVPVDRDYLVDIVASRLAQQGGHELLDEPSDLGAALREAVR